MHSRTWLPGLVRIFFALLLASSLSPADGYQTTTPQVTGYQDLQGRTIREAAAGTTIKIVGTNMGTSGTLDFNGRPATPTTWTPTALTVVVPFAFSYPTNGTVRLTTGGVTVFGPPFSILAPPPSPPPTISGYGTPAGSSITSALPGASVVIVGTNLGTSGSLTFNGIPATASAWSATAITATVPTATSYPNIGPVRVTTGGQTATGPNFTITAPAPPTPSITGYRTPAGSAITSAIPGTTIVIVGTNLGTTGTVLFNGIAATASNWTATAITVTVPTAPSYPNTGAVQVTTGGLSANGPDFTITAPPAPPPPPAISGYRALDGSSLTSAIPGTAIVIGGTNLGSSGTVSFNGISATASEWTATAVTVPVPAAPAYPHTGPVTITTGGQTATGPSFTINAPPAPSISGYRTPAGSAITSAIPGTTIVIAGTNLGSSGTVLFNGIAATPGNWTATAITVTVPTAPSYPNTGAVQVTTGGQSASGPAFTITAPPTTPPSISRYRLPDGRTLREAAAGTTIVIVGTNMGTSGTLDFNGRPATPTVWTPTALTVVVPHAFSYPTNGTVRLTTGGVTVFGPPFSILAPPPSPPPTISGYGTPAGSSITSALPGASVVIVGTNLGTSGSLTFNGISATASAWSATAITATVPTATSYPNIGPVRVTTAGRTATGPDFTITAPPPSITGYRTPTGSALTSAAPGTAIVIVGTNLGTTGTVRFNGIAVTPSNWTATAITVAVPTAPSYPNTGPVQVTTGGQTADGPNFTIIAPPAPSISGYRTPAGSAITSAAPGTSVVIEGANLGSSGTVSFNGIAATPSNWTATAITVTVPTAPSYPNTGAVQVTTGGQSATGPAFTITEPPPTNRPPTVSITSPATGATFPAPATVTLDATAGDPDGGTPRVEWYLGTTLLETDLAPPYSLTWSSSTPNPYTFTAKAIDSAGASTVSNAVTIQVTPSSPTVFKIMPFGDSITYGTLSGGGTTGGYRVTLWRLLEAAGFRIDFVGSIQSGYPFVPDPDNEGWPGATTQSILNRIQERILNLLGNLNPDVVLLMLGTNDLLQNLPGAPERLGTIMDEIAQQRPNATTIVAGIIPIRGMEAQVLAYNQAVVGQVTQRQAAGQRIRYVDMYSVVSLSDLPDGVHPNDSGYSNLGNAWYQALVPVLTGG